MNKKILITQRPQLLDKRVMSNHITRLPLSREKQFVKPFQTWHLHQSGVFSTRNRADIQNKPVIDHHRIHSTASERSDRCDRSYDRSVKPNEMDLVGLVSELAKLNTETQERLTELTSRLNRLEMCVSEWKGSCSQVVAHQVEKSLDEMYAIINRDFKNSEDSIIRHVSEIRDEVRGVTQNKLEEMQKQGDKDLQRRVEEIKREVNVGVQKMREEMRREVEKTRETMDGFKKKVQAEIGQIILGDCSLNKNKKLKSNLVRFTCCAKIDGIRYPVNIHEYSYYITIDGHLTDEQGYLIVDSRGESISLAPEHLQKLREAGLLLQ